MAKFKFVGLGKMIISSTKSVVGGLLEVQVPLSDGTRQVFTPRDKASGFQINEVLSAEITDLNALRAMRVDPRFKEVL